MVVSRGVGISSGRRHCRSAMLSEWSSLRRRVRMAARRVGLDVRSWLPERDADLRRGRFLQALQVDLVVDGGASVGGWARRARAGGYTGAIVSFEPLRASYAVLREACEADPSWSCVRAALGAVEATATLNVAGNRVSSSLLPMECAHEAAAPASRYVGTETVEVVRLDVALPQMAREATRVALKLDLQGHEAQALDGAAGIFDRVVFVESELSIVPLYGGQALYRDMLERLDAVGFELVALSEGLVESSSGRALQFDGMFVRRSAW